MQLLDLSKTFVFSFHGGPMPTFSWISVWFIFLNQFCIIFLKKIIFKNKNFIVFRYYSFLRKNIFWEFKNIILIFFLKYIFLLKKIPDNMFRKPSIKQFFLNLFYKTDCEINPFLFEQYILLFFHWALGEELWAYSTQPESPK